MTVPETTVCFGKDEFVIGVDGVDELGANRLADAHGKVIVDLDGERGSGGKRSCWKGIRPGLATADGGREQKRKERRFIDHRL